MRAAGEELPENLANPPELIDGLQFYLDAFIELDTDRNHSFDFVRIPWSSMWRYGEAHGLNAEQREDLVFFMLRIDDAHIARLVKKREQDGKSRGPSGTPNDKSADARSNRKR